MRAETRDADGVYIEAGEAGALPSFAADDLAAAFGVEPARVHRALAGEFGLGANDRVDSKMAQRLCEALLGDLPLDRQQAALMRLGRSRPGATRRTGSGPARRRRRATGSGPRPAGPTINVPAAVPPTTRPPRTRADAPARR